MTVWLMLMRREIANRDDNNFVKHLLFSSVAEAGFTASTHAHTCTSVVGLYSFTNLNLIFVFIYLLIDY